MVRVGVIVASANTVVEPDTLGYAPPGVAFAFTRVLGSEDEEGQLSKMGDGAVEAAELLSHARVTAMALGCTGGSFLKGTGYDQDIARRMEARSGVKSTTASTAVLEAPFNCNPCQPGNCSGTRVEVPGRVADTICSGHWSEGNTPLSPNRCQR